jgi:hypothetical protein
VSTISRDEILIRQSNSADMPFIYSSWLKTYKFSSPFAKRIRSTIFFQKHHDLIEDAMNRGMEILVACPKEGDETIIGYMAFERSKNAINFVYIKDPFRGFGVAKFLYEEAQLELGDVFFTHWCYSLDSEIDKSGLIYNPYLFLGG